MKAFAKLSLCLVLIGSAARGDTLDPGGLSVLCLPQPGTAPQELDVLIEIPAGSIVKYELDPASGRMRVDRFQSMPVVYPANYGTVPSSLAGDGDALDVLVYSREPIVPGALIRVRPIGVLKMLDGGKRDDKVITVPADDVDPNYSEIRDIAHLPTIERERLRAFFLTYKQLPAGRELVDVQGILGANEALEVVRDSLRQWQDHHSTTASATSCKTSS